VRVNNLLHLILKKERKIFSHTRAQIVTRAMTKQEPNYLMQRLICGIHHPLSILDTLDALLTHNNGISFFSPSFNFLVQHDPAIRGHTPSTMHKLILGIQTILHAWLFNRSEFILVLMAPQCPTACSLNLAASAPLDKCAVHED
jgi:hypothetical protein